MLSSALRRNGSYSSLQDFQQCLLYTLAGNISCDRSVFGFSCDFIDLIDVDDAVLSALDIIVCCLNEAEQNVFYVLANITCLGERRCVCNCKRNVDQFGQCLCQIRFSGTGRSEHQNVALLQFDVGGCTGKHSFVMVVNSNGEHFFRLILSDYVVIQKCFDFLWFDQVDLVGILLAVQILKLFLNDLRADCHAVITDVCPVRACDQLAYLVFCLSAERAADLGIIPFYSHRFLPFNILQLNLITG